MDACELWAYGEDQDTDGQEDEETDGQEYQETDTNIFHMAILTGY
jgi:hypothetical protein